METTTRDIFLNFSPLDHRYYLANKQLFERLSDYLSERASVLYCAKAETALLEVNIRRTRGSCDAYRAFLDGLPALVRPEDVYAEEERTQHNIRALVNVIKRHCPAELAPLVHMGATSADILDTAAALRVRDAMRLLILPELGALQKSLLDLAEREAGTIQIGRTHGQHAVPLSFGYAVSEYVSRLGKSLHRLERLSRELRGKLSGAVGAYNATSLFTDDPEAHEREYLELLGLEACDHATQVVEPEHLLALVLEVNTAFGIIANLADDLRHLQRSEIAEVREHFGAEQVGSSTMPQKRNPWNSEHVKSLWKSFSPRVMSFYMDQISEHQRDLTNSASARFVAEYLVGFCAALARMRTVVGGLRVDERRMRENVRGDTMLAEAAYVLLAASGETDAHESVRQATLGCEREGIPLVEALKRDRPRWKLVSQRLRELRGIDAEAFFSDPGLYTGLAVDRTRRLCQRFRASLADVEARLDLHERKENSR